MSQRKERGVPTALSQGSSNWAWPQNHEGLVGGGGLLKHRSLGPTPRSPDLAGAGPENVHF